ncbi:NAD-dependent epimerase/dehydratase family protein [Puia sp. P3]|uniref:NAD-dependent epimerase/dehydratase family protein n=1 Tax=Puia sp. P3 TaxID=3423952 RepID=UPI003D671B1D
MKILITGNLGYIGPIVGRYLKHRNPSDFVAGLDSGFFAHCLTAVSYSPEVCIDAQFFGDVRTIEESFLKGYDGIVHLAAVSNDPMGNKFEAVTDEINHKASVELARKAAAAGVKSFVFASSCSIYGFADGGPRKETDTLNPLTAYARSKVATEQGLEQLSASTNMTITSLRFSTACGMSDRIRLDLVLNDFVAGAITTGKITVLSDGSPWRPLIDVKDMARAIDWALTRPAGNGGKYLAVNIGRNDFNYQVKDIAQVVADVLPGTEISINVNAQPDKRSYKVDFLFSASWRRSHQPVVNLYQSATEIREGLTRMQFTDKNFRESDLIRLKVLEKHMAGNRINSNLEWINKTTTL